MRAEKQIRHLARIWGSLAVRLLSVIRNLERIADHATNIAEDVIFLREGD